MRYKLKNTTVNSKGNILEAEDMDNVLKNLKALADTLVPRLDHINCGRTRRKNAGKVA